MSWLGALGDFRRSVVGLNRRNLACVFPHNPRASLPVVDDKVLAKERLVSCAIRVPETRLIVRQYRELATFFAMRSGWSDFVVKPVNGAGGRGFRLGEIDAEGGWRNHRGAPIDDEDLAFHLAAILAGEHSMDGHPDSILVEELLREDPAIAAVHGTRGVADVRVIACAGRSVLAMLRLPTALSGGAANLHKGGIGVGIDLATGVTTHAVRRGRTLERHPDTGVELSGIAIPDWSGIQAIAGRVNRAFAMDYLGVDCVLERRGTFVLEVNARPGLEIQLCNRRGLADAMAAAGVPIP